MHGRHRVRLQHRFDPVALRVDLRVGEAARLRIHQLGEPAPHQLHPFGPAQRRTARHEPGRLRRRDVLADRSPVHPHTRRDIGLGPTRVPVLQNFYHIDHVERSPCHQTSLLVGARRTTWTRNRAGGPPNRSPPPHGDGLPERRDGGLRERHPRHAVDYLNADRVGALADSDLAAADVERAIYPTGPAGTITVHHCRTVHGPAPNRSSRARPLLLQTYAAVDAFAYTDLVRRSPHGEELVRGKPARWARHDPRPCLMPPTGPYRPIFAAQQREDEPPRDRA